MSDHSHAVALSLQEIVFVHSRPHVLMRPTLLLDGDHWCALYGEDLQSGCAGFGKSPELACAAFDVEWVKLRST